MFATKRRLTAMICIVGFLVVSFGMFTPPAFSASCSYWTNWCCDAICDTYRICEEYGSNSYACYNAQAYAGYVCATAAEVCGYSVYHLCGPCQDDEDN